MRTVELEGIAPEPTGTTRHWVIRDQDLYKVVYETLNEIRQLQAWGDEEGANALVEHLQGMDGFPRGEPGDHWAIHYEAPTQVVVPASRLALQRAQRAAKAARRRWEQR